MRVDRFDLRFIRCLEEWSVEKQLNPPARPVFVFELDTLDEFPDSFDWPHPLLYVQLFMDATTCSKPHLERFLRSIMDQGCVLFDANGQNSRTIEDSYDWLECDRAEVEGYRPDHTTMTTSSDEDSVEESLWELLFSLGPDQPYWNRPETNVIVVVSDHAVAERIRELLSDDSMEWVSKLLDEEE